MLSLLNLAATVTPAPGDDPSLRPGLDPADVTPGLLGFLATLFLVIAVIFLIRDMTRRIRRVRYREMALLEEEEARQRPEEARRGPGEPEGVVEDSDYTPGEPEKRHTAGGAHGPEAP
ncbi:hypothetical protein ASH00_12060 [Arthrobacter sp. Soil782]|uniref:hypothetical protein n=1 Tax=Arthrobacter sp. Soil782 TaxID=1736410 RepID=UPI0006F25206|nr:hypothetical protein [Arthrobacter sp. Soil782]KRF05147.1 hypothetical protein ASH00_12060 [Arthrobacter sp. Soil782]